MTSADISEAHSIDSSGLFAEAMDMVFDQSPSAMCVLDTDGYVLAANREYRSIFGAVAGRTLLPCEPVSHADRSTTGVLESMVRREADRVEVDRTFTRCDDSEFLGRLSLAPLTQTTGELAGCVGVIEPLDQRAKEQWELERSRYQLELLLNNISDTITIVDVDGRVIDSSGRVTDVLGYPTEFWETTSIYELIHPEDEERVAALAVEVFATPDEFFEGEFRVLQADGGYIYIEVTAVNMIDDPMVGGIVLTTRNVEHRKEIEAELANARDEAVELSKSRAEFVAKVSHEIRNPLHALLGMTELMATSGDPELKHLAVSAHRQASALRDLANDLLDLARMEAGRVDLDPEPIDLRVLAEDVASIASATAAPGVVVEATFGDDLPSAALLDGTRLRQVVMNLIGNATKFTSDGSIGIHFRARPDDVLRVEVSDSGVGVPEEFQAKLFEPFNQGDPSTAKNFGGTGLGLAISDRLVELMGGHIDVDSTAGQGATFSFEIPVHPTETTVEVDEMSETAGSLSGRVLVVEDSPVNQLLVSEQLQRIGVDFKVVDDGPPGLDELESGPFDVVLMDWQLPTMDGLDTTREVRRREHGTDAHVIIVGMTASAATSDRLACMDSGMDDFLPKPVSLEQLRHMLQKWLGDGVEPASEPGGDEPETLAVPSAETADPLDDPTAFDADVLAALAESFGAVDPVISVVDTYLDGLDERVDAVRAAYEAGDHPSAAKQAHALKSASAMLGALGFGETCRRVEKEDAACTPEMLTRFEVGAAGARARLSEWLDEHRPR